MTTVTLQNRYGGFIGRVQVPNDPELPHVLFSPVVFKWFVLFSAGEWEAHAIYRECGVPYPVFDPPDITVERTS